jgi:hypothetical protein
MSTRVTVVCHGRPCAGTQSRGPVSLGLRTMRSQFARTGHTTFPGLTSLEISIGDFSTGGRGQIWLNVRVADDSSRIGPRHRVLFRSTSRTGLSRLACMRLELDHLFICTAPGAPEAEEFVRFGLREGPPNQHPGQGTANRRFAFANAMIELLWAMHRKLKVNDRGALYSGRGGLVGKVRRLLSAFACAPWILRTQAHPFRRGKSGWRCEGVSLRLVWVSDVLRSL